MFDPRNSDYDQAFLEPAQCRRISADIPDHPTIDELGRSECRWSVGTDPLGFNTFCAAPVEWRGTGRANSGSYCAVHGILAFVKIERQQPPNIAARERVKVTPSPTLDRDFD
jgi:hypothetical protein